MLSIEGQVQRLADCFRLLVLRVEYKTIHSVNICYAAKRPVRTDLLIRQFETETLHCISYLLCKACCPEDLFSLLV